METGSDVSMTLPPTSRCPHLSTPPGPTLQNRRAIGGREGLVFSVPGELRGWDRVGIAVQVCGAVLHNLPVFRHPTPDLLRLGQELEICTGVTHLLEHGGHWGQGKAMRTPR